MNRKTILITGATDGIGKQTAMDLAMMGHHIILHGRSEDKLQKVKHEINEVSQSPLDTVVADFSSFADVRKMTTQINNTYKKIDVLLNNAGVFMNEYKTTEDNFETTLQVNHLSVFLLTLPLVDLLLKSEKGRIVTVSSLAHTSSPRIDFNNLNLEQHFDSYEAYAQSKICNIFFAYELAEILYGTGVTSNCLHPGVITTKLLKAGFGMQGASVQKGAETSVYLATDPELDKITGKYFSNKTEVRSSSYSYNRAVRKQLWKVSEDITGVYLSEEGLNK